VSEQPSKVWAIAAYFNPMRYRRRLANYRVFSRRVGIPLLTVELGYGDRFDLSPGDADILVQLRGGDVLWQKERLLNLAVAALPAACEKVVWLDCDVVFEDESWAKDVEAMLDEVALAQPFRRVHYLGPDWQPGRRLDAEIDLTRTSICAAVEAGVPPLDAVRAFAEANRMVYSTGFAWAARRELLERHGLYDASIIGGGDVVLTCASYGMFDEAARRQRMSTRRERHFRAWAEAWAGSVAGSVGALDATVYNMWHGHMRDRGSGTRHERLSAFDFDPAEDIAVDAGGAWRWSSDKPAMHAFVRDYFAGRKEDG
jgi:hypothetical protein